MPGYQMRNIQRPTRYTTPAIAPSTTGVHNKRPTRAQRWSLSDSFSIEVAPLWPTVAGIVKHMSTVDFTGSCGNPSKATDRTPGLEASGPRWWAAAFVGGGAPMHGAGSE